MEIKVTDEKERESKVNIWLILKSDDKIYIWSKATIICYKYTNLCLINFSTYNNIR